MKIVKVKDYEEMSQACGRKSDRSDEQTSPTSRTWIGYRLNTGKDLSNFSGKI